MAEDALLCMSLVGLEDIVDFARGSITGVIGRGRAPKDALLVTCTGPDLGEPTGPLELKRFLPAGESPCGPRLLDNFLGLVTELFLRACPGLLLLVDVPSL